MGKRELVVWLCLTGVLWLPSQSTQLFLMPWCYMGLCHYQYWHQHDQDQNQSICLTLIHSVVVGWTNIQYINVDVDTNRIRGRIQRVGDRWSGPPPPPPPLKKSQNIGFLSKTVQDPLKNQQSYQASIQFWAIIGTPAKCHLNGVLLAGRWWAHLDRLSPLKNPPPHLVKVGPPLTKLFWIRAWNESQTIYMSHLLC